MAAVYDDATADSQTAVQFIKQRFKELNCNPWCAICSSWDLRFERAETKFTSMEQAMPVLRLAEEENKRTRLAIAAIRNS